MSASVGTPTGRPVIDQMRRYIERHLPWYDSAAAERQRIEAEQAFAKARRVRTRANRVLRAQDGYRAYGERVQR